jgi:putative membrane protein
MRLSPYQRFEQKEMILRDHLAVDRTTLASERTFLAYVRTAFTMFITGLSLLKFFDTLISQLFAWIFIVFGIVILFLGGMRYMKFRNNIYQLAKTSKENKSALNL